MPIQLKYIEPNKWYHRAFNTYCHRQLKKDRKLYTDDGMKVYTVKPLFVTGFFRSGTSLTMHILETLGMDLGPPSHLLRGINKRADLNPEGFYENYVFMETSLLAFHKLNAWGHLPPSSTQVSNLEFDLADREQFAEFTLCGVHDDRITNKEKIKILKHYDILSLSTYLEKNFHYPFAIKNPHFAVLSQWLRKKWPEGKFLVCFREPTAAIASAAKITPLLNEDVYFRYYQELIQLEKENAVFFSYDFLLENPTDSVSKLAEIFSLNKNKIPDAIALMKPELHRFKNKTEPKNENVRSLIETLKSKAINHP